jgi:hypothetical protein
MSMSETSMNQTRARDDWERARRRAWMGRLLSLFTGPHQELLSFEDVREKLRLFQNYYKGMYDIPLDQIVGSVDRYQDFTREFLPLIEGDARRWQRVAALQRSTGLPPVELYKVGEVYFVKDGNHRVSVMQQLGAKTVEAHVWEYPTPLKITPEDDINGILVKAERLEFLEKTQLDELRPGHEIAFTAPGRYAELDFQIELYRRNLSLIDGYAVSYEDAVTGWYDMVYSLAAETIKEMGLLGQFPGRTVADLYIWIFNHRQELARRYGRGVSTHEAATHLIERAEKEGQPPVLRAVQQVADGVEHLAEAGARLVRDVLAGDEEEREIASDATPVALLARQVREVAPRLPYPAAGRSAWREWQPQLRAKLFELLGVTPRQGEAWDAPRVEIVERVPVEGARCESIYLIADDGLRVPAYVFVPAHLRERGQAPAVLIYPGHGTIRQTAGRQRSYHRGNALALAQAGFVTITVEGRGFGELGEVGHRKLDAAARLVGRTWMGLVIEDALRALDYIQARPEVDATRLGVAGMAVAGALAMYTAALDERITAAVIADYLVRFDAVYAQGPRYTCQCIPGLRRYAEAGDIGALIAPRPALYTRSAAAIAQSEGSFERIRRPYELLQVPDRLRYEETGPGRLFDSEAAIHWFKRWLVEEEATEVLRQPYRPD